MISLPKSKKWQLVLVFCWIAACYWFSQHFTRNTSPSLKQSLFYMEKGVASADIKSGDYVRFLWSDGITQRPVQMLKRVGCSQGQVLIVNSRKEYYCDGSWLGRAKDRSTKGVTVRNFVWNGPVPQGVFFALADHIDSYDSRYYGFVRLDVVSERAYPIF